MKRKPLSKSIRFDVLNRDNFTCQYCGKSAPEVVLHVDHIKPVSQGGDNSIDNLITSCSECNLGKSDKTEKDIESAIKRNRNKRTGLFHKSFKCNSDISDKLAEMAVKENVTETHIIKLAIDFYYKSNYIENTEKIVNDEVVFLNIDKEPVYWKDLFFEERIKNDDLQQSIARIAHKLACNDR